MAQSTTENDTYERFVEKVRRIENLGAGAGVLQWDQEVKMPDEGIEARSQQLSTLSAVIHEEFTDEEMGTYLDELESTDLDGKEESVVREIRRQYERKTRVPTELVEEISRTTSEALPKWKEAKAEDDFSVFAPILEELIELKKEYAEHIDPDADPYAVLFADYEPYIELETAEEMLTRLREELVPLIDSVADSEADLAVDAFAGEFDPETQEELARDALDTLGYDWDRGRLDTAPHPFSTGTQFDARVTTRFDETDLLGGLTSTIHEFGHATYTLGLPDEHYGTPLGDSRDLTVHESQSRLWENHVGRSRAFWELFLPQVEERFPDVDAGTEEAYEAANQVYDDNLIRVEADELTYHMHIVLRFEIERELIEGDLSVEEIPETWNEKMEEYLGVKPETDAEGCLQDIHWSHGSFGYFPTYSLGSVLAAQLYANADEDIEDLDGKIRAGEFDPLRDWLVENVHRHGARYTTPELIERATGESFTADHFLEYVTEKYGELYGI
ncbi:Carboxypeptidase Taq [Halalkalicoccus jeotgali B3]|uniref:Metal-dependent carboxypeptidase n=1 Tax=Halalkalicoccus jeotgali (strain DSM 18796 / CECT 7217 / JCM 14584 / KCTC 4019 / B3) TaxID=795797 RepID=D8J7Q5_HALJB|nr:carboxypeptidase M32 [Halalkalicoccus jeotgali]ADJ16075.1 Carboxypeptidase Taq [Halalkalicoccus jeotgali B3]